MKITNCFLFALLLALTSSTVVTLNGGYLTVTGIVTDTYLDFTIDFQANVQWLAMIWSQNQADTDVTLMKVNAQTPASPVSLVDCYLDQNSYIQSDNIQSLMPSTTAFAGSISNGIKVAFKRQLITGDNQDITIYKNSVIQVCFISANQAFVGNGFQIGNQKACSYISMHKNVNSAYDRMLGNFAATSTFGGGNLTVYATQSYDGSALETWLFLTVVHRVQGTSFSPRWIGVTYSNSLVNADLAIIEYATVGVSLDIHIDDYYAVSSTSAARDITYVANQGSQDLVTVLTAYDPASYFVGSFKRKYSTGDVNRDSDIVSNANNYCIIYGNALAYTSFTQTQMTCFNFTLTTQYVSNFRQTSSSSVNLQNYVTPANNVVVVKKQSFMVLCLSLVVMMLMCS